MLNETIEIDCDKEQLEEIQDYFTEDGEIIFLKVKNRSDRFELLDWRCERGVVCHS